MPMQVVYIIIFVFSMLQALCARGIPIDSIYISTTSPEYQRLLFTRLDYYQAIGAQFIDSGIAYAAWLNGKEVVYIKETGNTNAIMVCSITTRKKTTVYQFKGTVIAARTSANGIYIAVKYFSTHKIPQPMLIMVNIPKKKATQFTTASAGVDFSFSQDGNAFYYKYNSCIRQVMCDSYQEKEILCREHAPQWDENTVLLDSSHKLFISGSSGNYDVYMLSGQSFKRIFSAITPMEIFCAGTIAFYSGGFPGGYSVNLYSFTKEKTLQVLSGTFNPSLHVVGTTAIFLHNAFITVYDSSQNTLIKTIIESDEATLSPDQFSIASLLYNRLFILPYSKVLLLDPQAKRYCTTLESQYAVISQKTAIHTSPYSNTYLRQKRATVASLLKLF
ncbi:MAG: hypothetical protein N3F66_04115 [Spirochaetes bacterium]|nr:hypothetical protein [Spirochaetota bacterium]